jgi:hypothetical protein
MKKIFVILIIFALPKASLGFYLKNEIDSNVIIWVDNFLRKNNPVKNSDEICLNLGIQPSSITINHIKLLGKYKARISRVEIYSFGLNISHGFDNLLICVYLPNNEIEIYNFNSIKEFKSSLLFQLLNRKIVRRSLIAFQ